MRLLGVVKTGKPGLKKMKVPIQNYVWASRISYYE